MRGGGWPPWWLDLGTLRARPTCSRNCKRARFCVRVRLGGQSVFQCARARVGASGVAKELEKIVAGAGDAVRATGQDIAVLRRDHLCMTVRLSGPVNDGGQPITLLHTVAGFHVIEN